MTQKADRYLRIWLMAGLVLIIVQVLLGGITRLTGSGLSITEWKPILGALYPSNDSEWQAAFTEYKKIAQYQYLNNDYGLQQFKFIFFWEWLHRNWARLIAFVFFVPYVVFLFTGIINKSNAAKYGLLFLVGALQGLVGWLMVKSGVNDTNLYVDHFKLAAHFLTALLALVLVWVLWLQNKWQGISSPEPALKKGVQGVAVLIICVLSLQLGYGAFMAGLKAAAAAPTWPSINGAAIPKGLASASWVSNPINVHFVHRGLAYLLAILVFVATLRAKKAGFTGFLLWAPLFCVFVQVALGIASVLTSPHAVRNAMGVFEWNALSHQLVALFLLMSLIAWLVRCGLKQRS
ncbi:MAG: hypothetical protein RL660_1072 [Bacteroidota bacterium]|jgi:cytochrome c oxidase assembly protein subunit 15